MRQFDERRAASYEHRMDFEGEFKTFRNKLRTFDRWSLVSLGIAKLYDIYGQPLERTLKEGWVLWELLLFVRFALEHGGFGLPPKVKEATHDDFVRLMNRLKQLASDRQVEIMQGGAPFGSGTPPVDLMMRSMAFEQFTWQGQPNPHALARASLMFLRADYGRYDLKAIFERAVGVAPQDFLELWLLLWICTGQRRFKWIEPHWAYLRGRYPATTVRQFLRALALDWDSCPRELAGRGRPTNPYYQMSEVSPLLRRPLLRKDSGFYCYTPLIFETGLEHCIYDRMRDIDGDGFTTAFGEVFERYVEEALTDAGLRFVPERQLAQLLPGNKVVDFVVVAEDIVVMIEAKAVEAHVWAQVRPDPETRQKRFTALTKAVTQFVEMAPAIHAGAGELRATPRPNVYGLVVTYKEHYLGPGLGAWNDFLKAGVERELATSDDAFDPANLLFTSIQDFDWFLEVVRTEPKCFRETIVEAAAANGVPLRQKLVFRQHLDERKVRSAPLPKRIRTPFDDFTLGIQERLGLKAADP